MQNVNEYTKRNGLIQHPDKTKIMLMGSKSTIKKFGEFSMKFGDATLKNQKEMKVLGIIIDCSLTFDNHVNFVSKTVNSRMYMLSRISNYINVNTKIIITNAIINSIITYGIQIWGTTSSKNLKTISKLQRRAIRYTFNINRFDPVTDKHYIDMKWLKIEDLWQYFSLITTFKYVNTLSVPYFHEMFYVCNRQKLRNNRLNSKIKPTNNFGLNMFQYASQRMWSKIPVNISSLKNLFIFKSQLKKHLTDKYT